MLPLYMLSCSSPNNKHSKVDEFYTDKGDFDMGRIPLIKPYEATTPATGNPNWIVASIDTNSVPVTMDGTKEVRVANNMILLHCVNTTLNYQPVKEAWFVIIPRKQIIKSFETHMGYQDYLNSQGFKKEPKLYAIGRVFRYFDNNDYINWEDIN
jgi:hypothetical protein